MAINNDYEITDISTLFQWSNAGYITLSPKFQRNNVWNDDAKSYLIDSIIRGFAIPPIFVRRKLDIGTKTVTRDVIDGQQRISTILSFLNGEFTIKRAHNSEFYGVLFDDLPQEIKGDILNYKIFTLYVNENKDSVVYEMFARLNTNNYALNKQELRNAVYWGPFKVFAYNLSAEYHDFFDDLGMFTNNNFSRMADVSLINSLMILLIDGIIQESDKIVDSYYKKFNSTFEMGREIEEHFRSIMRFISELYNSLNFEVKPFNNKNYFYTLFAIVAEMKGYLPRSGENTSIELQADGFKNEFVNLVSLIQAQKERPETLTDEQLSIVDRIRELHRVHTTSQKERQERVQIISGMLTQSYYG